MVQGVIIFIMTVEESLFPIISSPLEGEDTDEGESVIASFSSRYTFATQSLFPVFKLLYYPVTRLLLFQYEVRSIPAVAHAP
jgi:hypothetical protein